jgi:hypothetical protein
MHASITLNNENIYTGNLDQWQQQPPEALRQYLNPNAPKQPWIVAAMLALAEGRDVNIGVTTHKTGYSIHVDHP